MYLIHRTKEVVKRCKQQWPMMKHSPMVDELRRDVHMLGVVGATGKAKIVQSELMYF